MRTCLICITILQADVDLVSTEVHEGELASPVNCPRFMSMAADVTHHLLVLAHANDEHLATELH